MLRYAPNPNAFHDAHSIYFQILADHGFIGLGLYLTLAITTLVALRSIIVKTRGDPRLRWITDLAAMINVSLISFAVSGAFLGLAYFDLMLTQLAIVVALQRLIRQYEVEGVPEEKGPPAGSQRGAAVGPGRGGLGMGKRIVDWYKSL
jgi:O-antigen ligase